ncbi:MAG: GNAT family N-acetyltransferase [Candidatus Thiodiazotropha sp. (ex Codakia rugifera)]|nr:GNAT family N-acetyltransferase [Candidatus Thiodiazotropha sp. (ex Codakia rugifera)]
MITKSCRFETKRLLVAEWHSLSAGDWRPKELAQVVSGMLTPSVEQSLPEGWQGGYTSERAAAWINERDQEGATLLVVEQSTRLPIGMMILFESDDEALGHIVRLGYLLSETVWGRGIATELVQGFIGWCRGVAIASIVGGVERGNITSQRVLEKSGFVCDSSAGDAGELFFELRLNAI